MGPWPRSLLWSLGAACLMGIVVGQTTTAQVSVASASASASAGGLPASPTANTAQVSTLPNPVATPSSISNPVAKAGEPSITPSITSAEDFSATVNVTASPAANATAVQVPTGVMSTGGPSASPFTSSTESTNCSAVNTTACMPCSPGTFPNKVLHKVLRVSPVSLAFIPMSRGHQLAACVEKGILAPSKTQHFVFPVLVDHSATQPTAARAQFALVEKRQSVKLLKNVHLACQVCLKLLVTTNAKSARRENTNYKWARRAVTYAQKITTALAQM
ncbi:uncharacterized protein LOC102565712 isoform X2 [Alligator mississippiensis]|uniref:uncharacterized protein LOC102565712 isoform X2 n=1 Tax=Alligator mississippiensis TaxID=8496 RepID=UPI00090728A7|nr:uncharacterized protein LOC102565712 isoform X2 [Alligator mississippiensis]